MKIPFAISARTARLIGMENFANAEGAVVELVKNAYDADADTCIVVADIRENRSESKLFIIDNGSGMTDDVIIKHWMTIGTDDKLINTRSSKKKRIKSGAKGIGRFALNRLGASAEMLSFVDEDAPNGYIWNVDWNKFEEARVLSDVEASLEEIPIELLFKKLNEYGIAKLPIFNKLNIKKFHGTILCISNLKDDWSDEALNNLLKNLEMLIPAELQMSFELYLYRLNDLQWGGKISPADYEDYDYKIHARYEGGREIQVRIERNELNLSKLETFYSKVFLRNAMKFAPFRLEDFQQREVLQTIPINEKVDNNSLSAVGEFEFTFFFLKNTIKDDRDKDGNQKYPYNQFDEDIRINWLDRFGGVRIYRDGFRVRPYGENGDDWLGLGRRQAKSPGGVGQKIGGYRIRPNQIAGIVNISRLTNTAFEDKSSREGIQENETFVLFKNLLLQIIEAFELDRNTIMFNLSELYKAEHPQTTQAKDIANKALDPKNGNTSKDSEDLRILARDYKALETELSDKEAELSMLRGLASMGITVATFTHELRGIMLRLIPRNELMREILLQYLPESKFEGMRFDNPYKELEHMKEEDEKLNNWISYSLRSIRRSKRDRGDISLVSYFKDFIESWQSVLSKKNIIIHPSINMDDAIINAVEMDLDSIFNNYITNSITAFLTSDEDEKIINIIISNDHGYAIIDFIDNGVGLAKQYQNNQDVIFNAFETSKVDNQNNKIGTGMGLFIAKGIISKYPDSMIVLLPVEKGFGIRTIFKIK
jgi:Histidine kinase-, DNA gyrase B-, and HSP90-like ATPase.